MKEIIGTDIRSYTPFDRRFEGIETVDDLYGIKYPYKNMTVTLDNGKIYHYTGPIPTVNTSAPYSNPEDWTEIEIGGEGTMIFSSPGDPSNSTGKNGDWFVNTSTKDWFRKESGYWELQFNSSGEQGMEGPQGIQGEKGDKGDPGEKGDKGDKGDKGEKN